MRTLKKMVIGAVVLSIFLILSACSGRTNTLNESMPKVYFVDQTKGTIMTENLSLDFQKLKTDKDQIQFVLDTLSKGPQITTIQSSMPMPIRAVNINGRGVTITFTKAYRELTPQECIALRTSLVYSLTELDFIDGVEFYIDDKPLTNANGEEIGMIYRNSIITDLLNPNPLTTIQTVTLYFPNKEGKLVKEERDIPLNNNLPIEKYIVEEIVKGPKKEGLKAVLPAETVVKEVETKEGLCSVDLSFDLKSKFFTTSESRKLMIYAITNSLTELPNVKKVGFLVDGKKEIEWSDEIDLRESFRRKENLIAQDE